MCTVTFLPCEPGYLLGMNRDEQLSRVAALPPARHDLGDMQALFPSEPGGGTWIGLNDRGTSFALINWYAVQASVKGEAVTRGLAVHSALPTTSPAETIKALATLRLDRIRPFRLIGVFPEQWQVCEWRWNLQTLEPIDHGWLPAIWISSGWDEPGAQATRSEVFQRNLAAQSLASSRALRRLHRSHQPERGPYSICMHRHDAATVSYTEVQVTDRHGRIFYQSGPPCCHGSRGVGEVLTLTHRPRE